MFVQVRLITIFKTFEVLMTNGTPSRGCTIEISPYLFFPHGRSDYLVQGLTLLFLHRPPRSRHRQVRRGLVSFGYSLQKNKVSVRSRDFMWMVSRRFEVNLILFSLIFLLLFGLCVEQRLCLLLLKTILYLWLFHSLGH